MAIVSRELACFVLTPTLPICTSLSGSVLGAQSAASGPQEPLAFVQLGYCRRAYSKLQDPSSCGPVGTLRIQLQGQPTGSSSLRPGARRGLRSWNLAFLVRNISRKYDYGSTFLRVLGILCLMPTCYGMPRKIKEEDFGLHLGRTDVLGRTWRWLRDPNVVQVEAFWEIELCRKSSKICPGSSKHLFSAYDQL